jgi:hypothetical protein
LQRTTDGKSDWVRECLLRDDEDHQAYLRELSETLDDLRGMVQLMFDMESQKNTRPFSGSKLISRKQYVELAMEDPMDVMSDSSYEDDRESDADLKPRPLFAGRSMIFPALRKASQSSLRSLSGSVRHLDHRELVHTTEHGEYSRLNWAAQSSGKA